MTQRTVKNDHDYRMLMLFLEGRKKPFTIDVTEGRDRTTEQNKLAFKWYNEISQHTGEEVRDARARCKLEFGVFIIRRASDRFRVSYDKHLKHLPYQEKLKFIRDTELPVTSLMNVKQMTAYLDQVFRHHAEQGIELTVPPDRYAFDPSAYQKELSA